METVVCAFCKSRAFRKLHSARDPDRICEDFFDLVQCKECSLVFTNPRPTEAELGKFYSQQYYNRLRFYSFDFIEKLLHWFQLLRVGKVKMLFSGGKVLDIGCGKGLFIKSLAQDGFEVYGIEPACVNADGPSVKGLQISCGKLSEMNYPEVFFDVVTLWHVFEHVASPRELLGQIKRIIKPQGILILELPNFESWEARFSKTNWFHLDLPRHLYHYTPDSLEKMLNAEGFAVIKKAYFSFEFAPFGLLQTILNMLGGEFNFLLKILKGRSLKDIQDRKKFYALGLFFLIIPFLPLIIIASILESIFGKGAILEIYAKAIR